MKKIILVLVVLTTTFSVTQAQVRFGVQAGAAFASLNSEIDGEDQDFESRIGMTLGFLADVPITDNFVFQPALNYVQKGGKMEETESGVTVRESLTFSYIELPLNFVYRSAPESGFFAGIGPVIGFGVGGKTKFKMSGGGGPDIEEEEDINFGSGEDEVKPLEIGGNIVAGYQLPNGVFIAANYNMGFTNLYNDAPDGYSLKNSYFGLKVGFKFGGGASAKK